MGNHNTHDAIAGWLATPAAYPHQPMHVECIETHISRVFLAGEIVYKLKKPVKFDFLDFSTVELRERACREEVRLNRRLAPDIYLDVVPVTHAANGALILGGEGAALDWLVKMRRLPTEQTIEALYRRDELRPADIDRLARTLVRFYQSSTPLGQSADEYRQHCEAHVRGNQKELLALRHHLPRGIVERIHAFQLQLLSLAPELFDERASSGRIVDGHGDLRPEHICLTDPVVIFDCIEFSSDLRRLDVADELCFLATECDFLGADWVGRQLLARYSELSGDQPRPVLLDFYKSYRACVRAKVAALREDQLTGKLHEAAAAEAARHLALANQYVEPWARPLVLVVGGLSGTGKTTLASRLADLLGAELLRTDVIRSELIGKSEESRYGAAARQRVYDEQLSRARRLQSEGVSVVLDGTFSTAALIDAAQALVTLPRAVFLAIECTCRPEIARQRIAQRLAAGRDASEARPETHDRQREAWEPWPTSILQCRVDTEQSLEKQIAAVITTMAKYCRV